MKNKGVLNMMKDKFTKKQGDNNKWQLIKKDT